MDTVFVQTRIVRSETTRGAEIVSTEARWRWLARPVARSRGWHSGLLEINGRPYRAECSFVTAGDATGDGPEYHWQVIDLYGDDGKHTRVTVGPDGVQCDCEHATYRGVACKHSSCVTDALADQEDYERRDWSAALERETAERRGVEVPF